jgi:ribosomal protein S3
LWIEDLIYIINICTYAPNAKLLSSFLIKILCSLKKQWAFIKITSNIIKSILPYRTKKINGIKFAISGKINGRNRKKTVLKSFGQVSTQTLKKCIKYSLSTSYNVYGAFSIKIWIVSLQN